MGGSWQTLIDHLPSSLRRALHRPGFFVSSSVILGLALGANVAAFAIFYGFVVRPLPYAAPGELLSVRERAIKVGLLDPDVSAQFYHNLKQTSEFDDAALYSTGSSIVEVNGTYEYEAIANVTPSTFSLLGVKPLLGRTLSSASGRPDGPGEAVLSYTYWRRAFGGSRRVLGRAVEVNGSLFKIVGVMPRRFVFTRRETAFWAPFVMTPALARSGNITYEMLIRRPPGWSLARVNASLRAVHDEHTSPSQRAANQRAGLLIDAVPYRQELLADLGGAAPFWGLLGATFALILLATLNTLNLAMARQRQRMGELHLRGILGASRGQLARTLLIEYLPVLVGTGIVAAALASFCLRLLRAHGLPSPDWPFQIGMDANVTAYLLGVTVLSVSTIAVGALATASLGPSAATALQELGTRSSIGRAFKQAQRLLAAAQICGALVLIISGLLATRSLMSLLDRPLFFEPEHVAVVTIVLPDDLSPARFWERAEGVFNGLPGVRSAALSDMVPYLGAYRMGSDFAPYGKRSKSKHGWYVTVSSRFLQTLGVTLVAGHLFGPAEAHKESADDVLVSASLARALFDRTDAVGEALLGHQRIIGVVPTLPWQLNPGADNHGYAVYLPLADYPTIPDSPGQVLQILVKSAASSAVLFPAIRHALTAVQPDAVIAHLSTLPEIMQHSSLDRTALTWLVLGFGGLAFLIAVFGVYAIVAFGTRMRLFELAIREVLGATRESILEMMLKEIAVLFAAGATVGVVLAFAAARALRAELYGVSALDPATYLASVGLIGTSVLCAALLPAWRATRATPAEIIRT
jgi:predicted permease